MVTKASMISEKYSAGPNRMASLTISGARKVRSSVPIVPATKEPIAEVARAAAPRPAGHQVALERGHDRADSPGVLSRIEVVEPPYMAP